MNDELTSDRDSFQGLEYAGWQKGAASYDDLLGSVTRSAAKTGHTGRRLDPEIHCRDR